MPSDIHAALPQNVRNECDGGWSRIVLLMYPCIGFHMTKINPVWGEEEEKEGGWSFSMCRFFPCRFWPRLVTYLRLVTSHVPQVGHEPRTSDWSRVSYLRLVTSHVPQIGHESRPSGWSRVTYLRLVTSHVPQIGHESRTSGWSRATHFRLVTHLYYVFLVVLSKNGVDTDDIHSTK